jgi:hypothetical protein
MMAALTLRGLDEATATRLKQEARQRGVSVNALLRAMVEEGLGLSRRTRGRRHDDLDHLAGSWSAADARQFGAATAAFEQVDEELWR